MSMDYTAAAQQTSSGAPGLPASSTDIEVRPLNGRRRFSAAYKQRILQLADGCAHGELGALLRREGLYSAHLKTWRAQVSQALMPTKRGRKPSADTQLRRDNERLQSEVEKLNRRLEHAELIIDVQKKVSKMLGLAEPTIKLPSK